MQTPVGAFLRGLLMLVCVTSILLAALCGPLLPAALSSILPGRVNRVGNNASQKDAENFFEPLAPPATPSSRPADPMLPGWHNQHRARDSGWPNQQPKLGEQWAGHVDADGDGNSVGDSMRGEGLVTAASQPFSTPSAANDGGNNPFGYDCLPQAWASMPRAEILSGSRISPLEEIHVRLQQAGVSYYALELREPRRPLYRFYCRLSEAAEPGSLGQFEAVDQDPFRAMWRVLIEVERYRYGDQVAGTLGDKQ